MGDEMRGINRAGAIAACQFVLTLCACLNTRQATFDGGINGLDFLTWQQGYPTTYTTEDLERWEAGYGEGSLSALGGGGGGGVATVTAVPEPTAGMLALSALAACLVRRRS